MKSSMIKVQGYSIGIEYDDYICLTDMAKAASGEVRPADVIKNWLRRKETVEFLCVWEGINNSAFKVVESDHFRQAAGTQGFNLSVDTWVQNTDANGIYTRRGKTGGTYAHKDIAFEFGAAISPAFKLYLIKEFQRLKEIENNSQNMEWNVRRVLSKAQYHIQTDAVKGYKIPNIGYADSEKWIAYAEEGDVLNLAMFGFTAKQWREANIKLAAEGRNVRDFASVNELTVLSTLEGMNAEMIKSNVSLKERLSKLKQVAKDHMAILEKLDMEKSFRRTVDGTFSPSFKRIGNPGGMFPEPPKKN